MDPSPHFQRRDMRLTIWVQIEWLSGTAEIQVHGGKGRREGRGRGGREKGRKRKKEKLPFTIVSPVPGTLPQLVLNLI